MTVLAQLNSIVLNISDFAAYLVTESANTDLSGAILEVNYCNPDLKFSFKVSY
jgi:hypothetical protein